MESVLLVSLGPRLPHALKWLTVPFPYPLRWPCIYVPYTRGGPGALVLQLAVAPDLSFTYNFI